MFEYGDTCKDIFIIMSGIVDIVITDGTANKQVLDVLGKGSVIGMNNILKAQKWSFQAVNDTRITARCIRISIKNLVNLSR